MGKRLPYNDDIDTDAVHINSMVEFSPDTTGDYYISASVYREQVFRRLGNIRGHGV